MPHLISEVLLVTVYYQFWECFDAQSEDFPKALNTHHIFKIPTYDNNTLTICTITFTFS